MLILMSVPLSSKLFLPWGECFCAQECDVLLGTLLVCRQSLPKSTHSPGLLAPLALAETTMQHHCTRCCSALPGSCSNCSREACWVCPLFLGLRGTSARPRELRTVEKGVCWPSAPPFAGYVSCSNPVPHPCAWMHHRRAGVMAAGMSYAFSCPWPGLFGLPVAAHSL